MDPFQIEFIAENRLRDALEELEEAANNRKSDSLWIAVDVAGGQYFGPYASKDEAVEAIRTADFTRDEFGRAPAVEEIEGREDLWMFSPLMGVDPADADEN